MTLSIAARFALLTATLALAACSTGSRTTHPRLFPLSAHTEAPHLRVNGESVPANQRSLLEVLLAKVSAHRIGLPAPLQEQPLVLIDGVSVSRGIDALAGIPAFHVTEVEVLPHVQASARYGNRGRYGAIVITTR